MTIKKLVKPIVLILCVVVIIYALITMGDRRGPLVYSEHLEDTAVTVDGRAVTFKDLAFYILYEERKIEEQARIYNPDSPKDYWNLHTNGAFIQEEAKEVVMGMAVHDYLFYQLAVAEGEDNLTPGQEDELQCAITDFWEDTLDEQWRNLPCDVGTVNDQIRIAAIAEKYQNKLAVEKGPSQAAYNYDGYYYSQILADHSVKINKKLWQKFVMGDITVEHTNLNYINGLTDADKKKIKEKK